jgi:hypothetical protein
VDTRSGVPDRYACPMDDTTLPAGSTALAEVPTTRACTRCDDQQHLLGGASGLGKYRCEHCELVVGFDLEADPAEFLLSRGSPSRYTKDLFGSRLLPSELRLP